MINEYIREYLSMNINNYIKHKIVSLPNSKNSLELVEEIGALKVGSSVLVLRQFSNKADVQSSIIEPNGIKHRVFGKIISINDKSNIYTLRLYPGSTRFDKDSNECVMSFDNIPTIIYLKKEDLSPIVDREVVKKNIQKEQNRPESKKKKRNLSSEQVQLLGSLFKTIDHKVTSRAPIKGSPIKEMWTIQDQNKSKYNIKLVFDKHDQLDAQYIETVLNQYLQARASIDRLSIAINFGYKYKPFIDDVKPNEAQREEVHNLAYQLTSKALITLQSLSNFIQLGSKNPTTIIHIFGIYPLPGSTKAILEMSDEIMPYLLEKDEDGHNFFTLIAITGQRIINNLKQILDWADTKLERYEYLSKPIQSSKPNSKEAEQSFFHFITHWTSFIKTDDELYQFLTVIDRVLNIATNNTSLLESLKSPIVSNYSYKNQSFFHLLMNGKHADVYKLLFKWIIETKKFEILNPKGTIPLLKHIGELLSPSKRTLSAFSVSGTEWTTLKEQNSKEKTLRNVVFDFIENCLLNHKNLMKNYLDKITCDLFFSKEISRDLLLILEEKYRRKLPNPRLEKECAISLESIVNSPCMIVYSDNNSHVHLYKISAFFQYAHERRVSLSSDGTESYPELKCPLSNCVISSIVLYKPKNNK